MEHYDPKVLWLLGFILQSNLQVSDRPQQGAIALNLIRTQRMIIKIF
jgi:hypothetical protein